jgi:hypothetical protein
MADWDIERAADLAAECSRVSQVSAAYCRSQLEAAYERHPVLRGYAPSCDCGSAHLDRDALGPDAADLYDGDVGMWRFLLGENPPEAPR